ncbi:MAG TPA: UvrD-helicase domain-containing protein [Candidatus Nanoarchaeia archaeon]|nr:UvrD-helicase domain-containing protein [Candidatus Nanoarchaeia archaeon]
MAFLKRILKKHKQNNGFSIKSKVKILKKIKSAKIKKSYLQQEADDIEKYSDFLSDLGDNVDQKRGVVSDSKRILVLAGAGSGKTKVLTKRMIHFVKNKEIPIDKILAITFTKAAAKEMRDRVGTILGINPDNLKSNIRTFHSFCCHILKQNEQFDILTEKEQEEIIRKIVYSFKDDEEFMDSLYYYIQNSLIDKIRNKDNENSRYLQVKNKPAGFGKQNVVTNSGILVKSKSERDIANFLFALGIKFEYEPLIDFGNGEFHPDFKLREDIFIEHWCYNEKTPSIPQIDKNTYLQHRKWKEDQYKKNGKHLISIEEQEMLDLNKLQIRLQLELESLLESKFERKEILDRLMLSDQYHKAFEKFIDELLEIINLAKSRLFDIKEIEERVKDEKKEKVKNFYNVLIPVMKEYSNILKTTDYSKKDFNDLIKDTVNLLKRNKKRKEYYQNKIKYLLIDEFQDVSYGEVELIKLLINKNTNLFAVGDDWQSIYGWRGSDVNYILNFEDYFGETEKIILPYNYRSTKNIVEASSYFIQQSKKQHPKDIKSKKEDTDEQKILQVNSEDDFKGANYVIHKIQKLMQEDPSLKPEDFLVLYRSSRTAALYKQKFSQVTFKIKLTTIHGSKGMEAKYVFVLGLKKGIYGFPNIYADKDIKRAILDIPVEDKEEEERRIFYVAMTRAKKRLFLISEDGNESEFLADIPKDYKFIYSNNSSN